MAKFAINSDTIAAISTPPGGGGIGIIRMSGTQSLSFLKKIFVPHAPNCKYRSHQMYYGQVFHPEKRTVMDEVLVVFMRSPKTYTYEDVVEIHCHGSFLVLNSVLEILLHLGARLAEPGEFTKRAFLNGRIDLTKAEAVIDILSAKTRKGVDLAQEQLAGALYSRIDSIRKSLVHIKAILEVAIDFPDEDLDIVDHDALLSRLRNDVSEPISQLVKNAEHGKVIREGISVVIIGLPNVGKSSLLNTLLQEERALVTSVPGTTRDFIEEVIDIHGMPVKIIDTAGIRENADQVERLGIQRARDLTNSADLVLFMIDGAQAIGQEDIELYKTVSLKNILLVVNKEDLINHLQLPNELQGLRQVEISAKMQTGIESLKREIFNSVVEGDVQWQEDGCVPNVRHKDALIRAKESAIRLKEGLEQKLTTDLLAVDLQDCLEQLGDIVGETTPDDVLDVIFEQFCLGK